MKFKSREPLKRLRNHLLEEAHRIELNAAVNDTCGDHHEAMEMRAVADDLEIQAEAITDALESDGASDTLDEAVRKAQERRPTEK